MNRWLRGLAVSTLLAAVVAAQPRGRVPEQSPRKALLEMLLGGDDALKKHLTLEVQRKIGQSSASSKPGDMNPAQLMAVVKAAASENLETFEAGPVLLSYENSAQHQKLEVRIDGEDLRGGNDQMRLSLHSFRNGVEEELPAMLRFTLLWKAQQNIWRLNAFTVSVSVPIGDPRIFDSARWTPSTFGAAGVAPAKRPVQVTEVKAPVVTEQTAETSAVPSSASTESTEPARRDAPAQSSTANTTSQDSPKISPARAMRLIVLAEDIYAQKHPATGFTCFLSELVNVGRGFEDGQPYRFIDPELAQGVYNGYRFMLTACSGAPVRSFQVVAEPVDGTGRAYCSNSTHELRGSDDGHGASCLASGRVVQR